MNQFYEDFTASFEMNKVWIIQIFKWIILSVKFPLEFVNKYCIQNVKNIFYNWVALRICENLF